jgi:kinetochore protein NNF1
LRLWADREVQREFESIMVNRQVVPKLNELESLIAEAATRRTSSSGPEPTPYVSCIHRYSASKAILTLRILRPHLLPPSTILSAHLHPSLTHHSAELSARLSSTQSQNALLHEEVTRQRREIDELLAKLEGVEGDVRAANDVLGGLVGELAKESREGEAVLKGKTA